MLSALEITKAALAKCLRIFLEYNSLHDVDLLSASEQPEKVVK